jgi:aryl-alcohol dehydrogenase-like predicted oxidoreductase
MIAKALAISDARGWERFISHQASYSLIERDIEFELVPMALDHGVAHVVWGPLAGGILTDKFRRGAPPPDVSRRSVIGDLIPIDEEFAHNVVDVAAEIADSRGVSVAQVAINWLLARPSVSSVMIGARTEEQLADNLLAATWQLTAEEISRLEEVSNPRVPYPIWHQRDYAADRPVNPWLTISNGFREAEA